jgi:hypothetical protein
MADQHEPIIIVDRNGDEHEFPPGFDVQKAAAIVREATSTPKEKDAADSTALQTLHELGGVAAGVAHTPIDIAKGAYGLVSGVASGARDIWNGQPPQAGKDLLDSIADMKNIPQRFMDATHYERGKMIGGALGNAAAVRYAPMTPRPIARGVGTAIEGTGKVAKWPLRISGAHSILSGNPVGAAMIAAPDYIERGGRALRQWGESEPAFMAKQVDQFDRLAGTNLGGKTAPPVRIAPPPPAETPDLYAVAKAAARPEEKFSAAELQAQRVAQARADRVARVEAKAAEDAAKAKLIEDAKAGLEATPPSIRQTVSASTPEGGRQSMSQSFRPPQEEAAAGGLSAAEQAQLAQQIPDPVKRAQVVAQLQGASAPPTAPVARPPIRIAPETQAALGAPVAAPGPPKAPIRPAGPLQPADDAWRAEMTRRITEENAKIEAAQAAKTAGKVKPTAAVAAPSPAPTPAVAASAPAQAGPPIRIAPATQAAMDKIPVQGNPIVGKSLSRRGAMSATPGFTVEDILAVGGDPKVNYINAPPALLEQIKAARAARQQTYRINAGMDKAAKFALDLEE